MFRPVKAIFRLNIKQYIYIYIYIYEIQCHKMDEISFTLRHTCATYQLLKSERQHLNNSIFNHTYTNKSSTVHCIHKFYHNSCSILIISF